MMNTGEIQLTLEGGRELAASAEQEKTLLILEELRTHFLDGAVLLEDLFELVGKFHKTLHDILSPLLLRSTVFAERQCEHGHGNKLGSVCFR